MFLNTPDDLRQKVQPKPTVRLIESDKTVVMRTAISGMTQLRMSVRDMPWKLNEVSHEPHWYPPLDVEGKKNVCFFAVNRNQTLFHNCQNTNLKQQLVIYQKVNRKLNNGANNKERKNARTKQGGGGGGEKKIFFFFSPPPPPPRQS